MAAALGLQVRHAAALEVLADVHPAPVGAQRRRRRAATPGAFSADAVAVEPGEAAEVVGDVPGGEPLEQRGEGRLALADHAVRHAERGQVVAPAWW